MFYFPPLYFTLLILISLPLNVQSMKKDSLRAVPSTTNKDFYLSTPIGPYLDILADPPLEDVLRDFSTAVQRTAAKQATPKDMKAQEDYDKYTNYLDNTAVDSASKRHYVAIAKNPNEYKKGPKAWYNFLDENWFLSYKGEPLSIIVICTLLLPIVIAGLLQMCINNCCLKSQKMSRRKYEFPVVPVLFLQQTRREYFLRKKTVRRFCIQWEVGRINIRINTRLVDLKQILHPFKKRKKVHKYTTWRIIRLIVRFNAFLVSLRQLEKRKKFAKHKTFKEKMETWSDKVNTSNYILEKQLYDEYQDQNAE